MKIRPLDILFYAALIGADFVVYVVIAFGLMSYEDHYDSSKGAMWNWASMDNFTRVFWVLYNLWIIVNAATIIYFLYKAGRLIYKAIKN